MNSDLRLHNWRMPDGRIVPITLLDHATLMTAIVATKSQIQEMITAAANQKKKAIHFHSIRTMRIIEIYRHLSHEAGMRGLSVSLEEVEGNLLVGIDIGQPVLSEQTPQPAGPARAIRNLNL